MSISPSQDPRQMCPDVFSSEPGSRAFPMRCDDDFDATQRLYTESFTAFDAETFRRLHHPGGRGSATESAGVRPIMAALATHFERLLSVPGTKSTASSTTAALPTSRT